MITTYRLSFIFDGSHQHRIDKSFQILSLSNVKAHGSVKGNWFYLGNFIEDGIPCNKCDTK